MIIKSASQNGIIFISFGRVTLGRSLLNLQVAAGSLETEPKLNFHSPVDPPGNGAQDTVRMVIGSFTFLKVLLLCCPDMLDEYSMLM